MPLVRSSKMNKKLIKGVLALCCTTSGLALSFRGHPVDSEVVKNAKPVAANSTELVISDPAKPADYGIGNYKVEGVLAKGTKVTISLDGKDFQEVTANTEDGQYDVEVDVKESGKHVFYAQYKNAEGKEVKLRKDFIASDKKFGGDRTAKELTANNAEPALDKGNNEPVLDKIVVTPKVEKTPPEDANSEDPNSSVNRKAGGVHDENIHPTNPPKAKPAEKTKPTDTTKSHEPTKSHEAKVLFVLSSHTNFNVVPHGIIRIGGKGKPGDKVMLLVDNKPSMRGTIKPDGKWTFPVKVAKPGFRRITAQNLTSREAKSIKLKIK